MNKKETIEYLIDTLEKSIVVHSAMDELGEDALLEYLDTIEGLLESYIREYNNTGKAPLPYIIKAFGLTSALHAYYSEKPNKK